MTRPSGKFVPEWSDTGESEVSTPSSNFKRFSNTVNKFDGLLPRRPSRLAIARYAQGVRTPPPPPSVRTPSSPSSAGTPFSSPSDFSSEGGRTKHKWSTVKLVSGDNRVGDGGTYAKPYADATIDSPYRMSDRRASPKATDIKSDSGRQPHDAYTLQADWRKLDRNLTSGKGKDVNTIPDAATHLRRRKEARAKTRIESIESAKPDRPCDDEDPRAFSRILVRKKLNIPSNSTSSFIANGPTELSCQQKEERIDPMSKRLSSTSVIMPTHGHAPIKVHHKPEFTEDSDSFCSSDSSTSFSPLTPSPTKGCPKLERKATRSPVFSTSKLTGIRASSVSENDIFTRKCVEAANEKKAKGVVTTSSKVEGHENCIEPDTHTDSSWSMDSTAGDFGATGDSTSARVYECPQWRFDTGGFNTPRSASGSDIPVTGSDCGIDLATRMMEDFGYDGNTLNSRAPTPCSDISSELHPHQAAKADDATSVLHATLQSTVEEEQVTEFLTPPRTSGASRTAYHEKPIEKAFRVLGLERYISVDRSTLEAQFVRVAKEEPADSCDASNAFRTVLGYQDNTGCWETCLRESPSVESIHTSSEREFAKSSKSTGDGHDEVWHFEDHSLSNIVDDPPSSAHQLADDAVPASENPVDASTKGSAVDPASWTKSQDRILMMLKADRNCWTDIAKALEKRKYDCKERFKQIKPKDWKPKETKSKKTKSKVSALKKAAETEQASSSTPNGNLDDVSSSSNANVQRSSSACLNCDGIGNACCCNDPVSASVHEAADEVNDNVWGSAIIDDWGGQGGHTWHDALCSSCGYAKGSDLCRFVHDAEREDCEEGLGVNDGWETGSKDNTFCPGCDYEKGTTSYKGCNYPANHTIAFLPCNVTYWATIQSDGQQVDVPIESKHVSGPEKTIFTSGMPKVWKWVHDMGLGDKVGLQDAFDLAWSMHEDES